MRPFLATISVASLSTWPAAGQAPFPPDSSLRAMLQQLVNTRGIKGLIVGVLDETGRRRVLALGEPGPDALAIDAESVFEIGSITKVFTGILLADMVRRGEAELADPVADLLPGVRVPARSKKPITLLDLTTHFSGLPFMPTNLAPADRSNPFADYTVEKLYDSVSGHALERDPGDAFEYSNPGVALLGHALAARAGTTYSALVADRILRPLGMTQTAVGSNPRMRRHLVRGHDRKGAPVANWDFPGTEGMGGLRSTMTDMLTFASANLSSRDTGLVSAMRDSHRTLRHVEGADYPGMATAMNQARIGYNWFVSRPGKRRITWAAGLTAGYSTFLAMDIEARRAVVVLTNTGMNNVDYIAFHLLDPTVPLPGPEESR